jgi:hypothetical protein
MKQVFYLHIGYPKTATTTLQKYIFVNLKNIYYLGNFSEVKNENYLINQNIAKLMFDIYNETTLNIDEYAKKINSELKMISVKQNFLLSFEQIIYHATFPRKINNQYTSPLPILEIINRICKIFKKFYELKIIITLRKQDELFYSLYAESYLDHLSMHNNINSIDKYSSLVFNNKYLESVLNYELILIEIIKNIELNNLLVMTFEEFVTNKEKFLKKIVSFLQCKYSDIKLIPISNENNRTKNNSKIIKVNTFYFLLAQYKIKFFGYKSMGIGKYFKWLKKVELPSFKKNKIEINLDLKQKILNKYCNSNKIVSNKFGLELEKYGYYVEREK